MEGYNYARTESLDIDCVVQAINRSVGDVLKRSLSPFIEQARESSERCCAVSDVLRQLPEFRNLVEEKTRLVAENQNLRERLRNAESSSIQLTVTEVDRPSESNTGDGHSTSALWHGLGLNDHLYGSCQDSLSDDDGDEDDDEDNFTLTESNESYLPPNALGDCNGESIQEDLSALASILDDDGTNSDISDNADSEDDVNDVPPSFPTQPRTAQVEDEIEEEEEVEEEIFIVELEIDGVTTSYYTPDPMNGTIYEIGPDEEPGIEIGQFENGDPIFEDS